MTKEDLVPLTLCPLMGGNLSQKDRIKKALEFSRKAEEGIPKKKKKRKNRIGGVCNGREEGRAEERYQNLISKILRKIQKNCTVPEMADMLEEDVEDPLMQEIRYLDKLVDELAKGKSMEKY